ncbi:MULTISPECIES: exodeoxyribonuclease V subunit gamma [Ramlibacter]|uniref:RecBCD enzyme subunit RecC n=1 Tax=Ramlibacter aquaticus TaxID=2780094 RepID=A0ABR9SJJ8_9BURK|nr:MULTISPECIES: exodeoxyribonuclease V subunit gamma [Ramlibacter]MBE7942202.1 exodeoxyribonuclease V subunit gamma [Ramlibacter aquaticus]
MLHLHFSNRLEPLASLLLQALQGPREDPAQPDTVVIPHSAASRHLALGLAAREGVAANLQFGYLARWLWAMVARVLPQVGEESPFDAASLTWRLYALLRDPAFTAAHPPLAAWLQAAGGAPLQAFELAERAAGLLEQYITYRPDWLQRWGAGERGLVPRAEHESWQAAAWQRIAQDLSATGPHPMEEMARVLERAGEGARARFGLPAAAHVFALASIPPLYLQALQALSACMDLHVYALNPSREYWDDGISPRALDRLAEAGRAEGREVLHPLLLSWAGQAKGTLSLLHGVADTAQARSHEHFVAPAGGHLLARLQASMLDLVPLGEGGKLALDASDRSLEVHVCHSLTRELEVLHDHLLGLFAADPGLRPCEVLVVTPDLEAAAPLVDAVFGTAADEARIPYALTGRRRSGANLPARAFLGLLAVATSRCTATQVHGLLQQPIVARRFGLDGEGLERIHRWILDSGIRWGLDADHVAREGLPAGTPHTLADGLSRLFLGHALPAGLQAPLGGVLPCAGAGGPDAADLGAFWQFVQALRGFAALLRAQHAPDAWTGRLHAAVERFLAPEGRELDDTLELHAAIDTLAGAMARAGFAQAVPAAVVRAALERVLDDDAHGGAETGRVTFSGMSSLRNIPFRVVCVIGLGDGAFPTADRPAEFDLMALAPRVGDRQRRTDQRNLFLDLLLAARDSLYLSYTGRGIRDNGPLPASVLVGELLDHVRGALQEPAEAARLVVEHPLQPFSHLAFLAGSDPRIRSHDAGLARALREGLKPVALADGPQGGETGEDEDAAVAEPAQPFIATPLAAPGPAWHELPLERLLEFFGNPSRYLLRRRLGLELPQEADTLQDDEPFLADFDGRARLAERLLPVLLAGAPAPQVLALARAGTEMPRGPLGEAELRSELGLLRAFSDALRAATATPPLPPQSTRLAFDLEGEAWSLAVAWADLRPEGLVRWRYDDERPTDITRAWLSHLVLCAWAPPGVACVTRWLARDGITRYEPLEPHAARQRLRELMAAYREGLSRPVHFFPRSAATFIAKHEKLAEARKTWQGHNAPGERAKPGHALALRGLPDPFDEEFVALAQAMFKGLPSQRLPLDTVAGAA